ncbi:hypothetical protein HMPREF9104_01305, partial [Lentilactobacillus kisonensis F0435]
YNIFVTVPDIKLPNNHLIIIMYVVHLRTRLFANQILFGGDIKWN